MEKKSLASGNNFAPRVTNGAQRKDSGFSRCALRVARCPKAVLFLMAFLLICVTGYAENTSLPVRKAAVAGGFYPAGSKELEKMVDTLILEAHPPEVKGKVRGIIVPHAGYIFSGRVAADAYKTLQGQDIKTVVLLGNCHTEGFNGISVYKGGAFETPLGLVEIDQDLAAIIMATNPQMILDRPSVHQQDHILEVQLPFLQRVLHHFKIVPIVFGNDHPALTQILADALKDTVDDKTLIVVSTDMSHYPPYALATTADHETIRAISSGKAKNLDTTLQRLSGEHIPNAVTFLCGVSAVRTLLLIAQDLGLSNPQLLKYTNSGDSFAGDKNRVVGYSSFVITDPDSTPAPLLPEGEIKVAAEKNDDLLNPAEQKELLSIARASVESAIRGKFEPPPTPQSEMLHKHLGAFVTLHKHGQLRGCIGRFEPDIPLYLVVTQMAIAAATQDRRFQPVSRDELGQLDYEVSVLSPTRNVKSADEIDIGKHGVTVGKAWHSGVFLPQVAKETGWSKEEFLAELCSQKAGLPRDCWKDPSVQLSVFTAQVFAEEEKK